MKILINVSHSIAGFIFLSVLLSNSMICCTRRKVWATVPRGKVELIIAAETILITHGCKPRTHDIEPRPGFFNELRIVLEINAILADRPGISPLN